MQGQNNGVYFKSDLLRLGIGPQMAGFTCHLHGAVQSRHPGLYRGRQRITHRPAAVVKLNRAADENTTRLQLDSDPLHPVGKQRTHPRQAARLGQCGSENFIFKTPVVLAHHRDLQLFARAEVRKNARLAHAHDLGHRANAQTLQPDLRGQAQRGVNDGGFGLLALVLTADGSLNWRSKGCGVQGSDRHGKKKRTIVLFCMH